MSIRRFLLEKRRSIAAYCLCAAILAGVNLLYGCTWEEECYAAGLACAAGLCLLACAYVREARQVRRLRELRKEAAEGLCEECPTETEPEQELAEILRVLSARCASLQSELDTVRRESMDYITVWVHQIKNPIAGLRLILKDGSFHEQAEMESELTRIEQYVDMVLG